MAIPIPQAQMVRAPRLADAFFEGRQQAQGAKTAGLQQQALQAQTQGVLQQQQFAQQEQITTQLALAGDPKALRALSAINPQAAEGIRKHHESKAKRGGQLASAVLNSPESVKDIMYKNMLKQASLEGLRTDYLPAEWSPEAEQFMQFIVDSAAEIKPTKESFKTIETAQGLQLLETGSGKITPALGAGGEQLQTAVEPGAKEKPPQGYRFTESGNLEAIPGGPAGKLSAESTSKVALAKQGNKDVGRFRKLIFDKKREINRGVLTLLSSPVIPPGKGRLAYSLVYNAMNARLRLESGAAVPETEVARAVKAFLPKPLDTKETIESKVNRMEEFFNIFEETIKEGRGGKPQIPTGESINNDPLGIR